MIMAKGLRNKIVDSHYWLLAAKGCTLEFFESDVLFQICGTREANA